MNNSIANQIRKDPNSLSSNSYLYSITDLRLQILHAKNSSVFDNREYHKLNDKLALLNKENDEMNNRVPKFNRHNDIVLLLLSKEINEFFNNLPNYELKIKDDKSEYRDFYSISVYRDQA